MDSLAAAPGTGPATSPIPVLRPTRVRKSFADLPTDRSLVMGILNVTPDSFSDGGKFATADDAIAEGLRMHYAGADIVDVGGESTRPNADRISAEDEQKRIIPVISTLVKAGALVSVDTMNASTAAKAIEAGAAIINDVSGLEFDPEMPDLVAERGVHYVLMHQRGNPQTMATFANYDDVVDDVITELTNIREKFYAAGVSQEQIIVDPGIGFAKNDSHNWALLGSLERLEVLGHRILVGASRKRFLGSLLSSAGKAAPPSERDSASIAVTALAAAHGAWCVRVHDVAANLDAVKVAAAWTR
ncbi:dihydropteroate synthase [Arthrobacter sp.]|uniref:dihydropteroate synthase n=1 Tax=Arthrobacter sp. TaxID=1667 RepID=UPI0028119CCA|nr:dihydropteroate synthase [Arthrobacter sp.]